MRSVRISVFGQDDPLYRFCNRRGAAGRVPVDRDGVLAGLRRLEPGTRVTFAGSDPLEHPDFPEMLETCRELELGRVQILTDGFGLGQDVVIGFLERSVVDEVLVVLPAVDPDLWGRMMRSLARFQACARGVRNAAGSGLATYVVLPLTRLNLPHLDELLEWLDDCPIDGVLVAIPDVERVPRERRDTLLDHGEASRGMARVFGRCRAARREIGVFERQPIPPCAADGALDQYGDLFNQRLKHMRAHGDATVQRVPACEGCELSRSCPGVERAYVQTFGVEGLRPVSVEEANRWYTKPINRLDEIQYTRVSPFDSQQAGKRGLLRINGHCNMGCSFCFVDLSHPDVPEERLLAEIDRLASVGVTHLVLSGGEPSLHPALPRLVARAREHGIEDVEVQTNGVKFARADYAERIVSSGLTTACVSLHSSDAEESDAITKQPNAFAKTVQALHNFRDLGVWTRVSHVINRLNYKDVPTFVRWLRRELPDGMLDICFARAQEISSQSSPWILPSFTEIKPYVKEALDFCLENEISFSGLIGQGGYPPCMLDGDLRYYENAMDQIHRDAGGSSDFVKAERCSECSFEPHCVGVRRAYVERYGDEEMRPF